MDHLRNIKINHLRNVLAIVEQGSLRAASRKLGLAQPAFSRSIQELERQLGTPLFERGTRGMTLTPVGIAFVERAKNIMTEIRKAGEEAEQLSGGTGGNVTVAMSIVAHFVIAPKVLQPFARRYPDVQLHIIEGLYTNIEAALREGRTDFYVGPPPEQPLPPGLVMEKLFDSPRKIFCRKDHPLAGAKSIRDLAGAVWMTTSITHRAQNELAELFRRNNLPMPRLSIRTQSALTFMTALTYSDCIGLLPEQWASSLFMADRLAIIEIDDLPIGPPMSVIKRSGLPLTPAAEHLFDLVLRSKQASPAGAKKAGGRPSPRKSGARR